MELKDIHNLIKFVSKSGVKEVDLEFEDIKIKIKNESEKIVYQSVPMQSPMVPVQPNAPQAITGLSEAAATTAPKAEEKKVVEDTKKYVEIKSPMIGTFYQRPSPDKDTFVKVGDKVSENSVVCMIEAMKLFNDIEAEVSGTIVEILVENATPVEYGQPLFLVDPS